MNNSSSKILQNPILPPVPLYLTVLLCSFYLIFYTYFSLTPPITLFSPAGYQHQFPSVLAVSFGVLCPLTMPLHAPNCLYTCILFPHHISLQFGLIYCVGLSVSVLPPIIGTQLLICLKHQRKMAFLQAMADSRNLENGPV